jgi:hypothetical protein
MLATLDLGLPGTSQSERGDGISVGSLHLPTPSARESGAHGPGLFTFRVGERLDCEIARIVGWHSDADVVQYPSDDPDPEIR